MLRNKTVGLNWPQWFPPFPTAGASGLSALCPRVLAEHLAENSEGVLSSLIETHVNTFLIPYTQ